LRAITPDSLKEIIASCEGPKHIHIAEQPKEVADCIAWSGRRPIQWLLENTPVDSSWCLVHATHATTRELKMVAAAGAVIGLCPTTEANLGDGVFPAEVFMQANGRFAIGSDSQVSLDPAEELRLLEYSQRLTTGRRGILATDAETSVGEHLFTCARSGGLQALGLKPHGLTIGAAADLIVLDGQNPLLANKHGHEITDSWVFSGGRQLLSAVMTQGQWRR
jgi:formimidoylglutamate deiminase